jgi:DNA-binding protein HU-beta
MAKKPAKTTKKAKKVKADPAPAPAKKSATAKAPAKRYKATPAGTTDKNHLISVIRETTGCTALVAKEAIDGVLGTITSSLKKNKKVRLIGFGSFVVAKLHARRGRNPHTGETIRVKASKTVRFKVGQTLKRSV